MVVEWEFLTDSVKRLLLHKSSGKFCKTSVKRLDEYKANFDYF